jgi:hypothetical protein
MKSNAKLILIGVVAIAIVVGLWLFFRPSDDGPTATASGCVRPAELKTVDDRKLKLAATQVGKIAVGELNLEQDTEVVQLLSENSKKLLVFNYLMCEARARGELDPSNPEQMQRVQIMNAFLSTNPNAEQFIELQKLLKGESPTARLVIPDLSEDNGKQVLALIDPVQTVSLLNAGKAELSAWVRNESPGRLMVTPRAPVKIEENDHVDIEIALLAPPQNGPWKLRFGSSATDEESEVEVRVAIAGKLADLLGEVATQIQQNVAQAPDAPATAQDVGGTPAASVAGAQWLASQTHDVIKRKYPGASDEVRWALSGSLLEQMNWNGPAVIAYRNSRASLGDAAAELDMPLSRAQVLANVAADPTRGEKPPAEVLTQESADLSRLGSLQLASGNALVMVKPELAKSLSDALVRRAALAPFAQGLKGDVALATNSPQAAVEAYEACARQSAAPSCTLRKAEAQVRLQDLQAADVTLSKIAAQTPATSQGVTKVIARDARRAAAATVSRP